MEVLVRDGRYYTIGDNGAEFIKYKKGDIIFNHVQSEQLFRNGKVTAGGGRAKALANGTAFVGGSYPSSGAAFNLLDGVGEWIAPKVMSFTVGYDYSSNKDSNSDNSDKEKTQEIFDWVEVAIDRIEREIDNLDRTANSTYKSWSERNAALADQINMVGNEIALQEQAIKVYQQALSEISLDQKYIDAIKNGSLSIDNIDDEVTADKISDYQKWYEKILDCTDKIEELKQSEAELYMQRIENAAAQYEGILNVIEHKGSMIEEYMSQAEAQGWLISANYYEGLISNAQQSISQLEQQKAAMLAELGNIAVGTEDWYKAVNMIDEVTLSIEQNRTAILEWQQAIQQADWEVFDLLQEQMADVADEAQFFIELLSNKKLYDDNGKMTNEGMATMGQHGVAYNVYMHQADEYAREAEKIKAEMANDPYDTELEKRYRELISLQREHILEAENEKNAIRDMVEEGINLELDALQERIDLYNENLQSAKDLYEYQKKVKEQTEEIASLEKQMSAYQGDDSEEAKAKIQELKVSLEDARENLEETEYEKYISDQQKLLDNLFLEYETVLNTRLDDIDGLMTEMIAEINANAGTISSTLHEAASDVGYTLSNSMETIWSGTNNVIQMYGQQFNTNQTNTYTALNNLRTRLDAIVAAMNAKALADVQKANTSSVADTKAPAGTKPATTTPTTPPVKPASTADGVPRVGDAVKFIKGKYYYDSQGQNPSGSQMLGQTVYIGIINERSWATHKYALYRDKEFKHGLGWVTLEQISEYAQGTKYIDDSGLAWTQEKGQEYIVRPSDGAILTPVAKGDSVLNAQASGNIWDMANNPSDFIKDNLNLGVTSTPNNSNVQNSYVQNLDKVVFNFPNVKNYDEMLSSLRDDPNFERLLLSMTINQLAGKSSLAKGKSIR